MQPWVKISIGLSVASFVVTCYVWMKPISDFGKMALRLCVVNAVGWFILLSLSAAGHPPPWLFPALLFWLLNIILLPAIVVVLWMCRRDGQERNSYLAVAFTYVALNVIILYVLPVVGLALLEYHR